MHRHCEFFFFFRKGDELSQHDDFIIAIERGVPQEKIYFYILIFITSTIFFDKYSLTNYKIDIWTKNKFVSLMNLHPHIAQWGPLWLFWDGNNVSFIHTPKNAMENLRMTDSYLK